MCVWGGGGGERELESLAILMGGGGERAKKFPPLKRRGRGTTSFTLPVIKGNHANIDLKFRFLSQLPDLKINPYRSQKDNKIHRLPLKP